MTWEPVSNELEIAIWSSGRIIWRDNPKEWVVTKGKWHWRSGKHFEATISPSRVVDMLQKIREARVLEIGKWWGYVVPDSSTRQIQVSDGNRVILLASTEIPPPNPHRKDAKEYERGRKAWFLIQKLARELIPTKGRSVPSPDVVKWIRGPK